MQRIAVIARLRPGSEDEARKLIESGPPFSLAELGLRSHDIYLGQGTVVFVFIGPDVEREGVELLNDPVRSASFSAWGPLLEGAPSIAQPVYHWESDGA
ncbi:MAG TPA: hypothetical protein VLK53_12260 [Gaiellaceae bacterium]|nr:hypothetical protein [Gaiellaceae bacterium]